jgi:hypothetical protein
MIKNEQLRDINQHMRTIPTAPTVSLQPPLPPPPPAPMLQTTSGFLSQRLIDSNAIDITSLKGQFAWEKIPNTDTYMPVIFRQNTKYFCIRMLRKLLPDYPEDVIRRSLQYQYRKPIHTYPVTTYEIELLNRINSHHSRWTYSRQPFTKIDELVSVSDFLSFYEHIRRGCKPTSTQSNTAVHTLRQLLPQSQQPVQRLSDFVSTMPSILRGQPTVSQVSTVSMSSYPTATGFPRETVSLTSRPVTSAPNIPRPSRPQKSIPNPYMTLLPPQPQSMTAPSNNIPNFISTVPSNNTPTFSTTTPLSLPPSTGSSSSLSSSVPSSSPIVPSSTNNSSSPTTTINQNSSTSSLSPSRTTLSTKPSRLHCGWLQVNKLYTPYISPSATNHHLYKLPVSLLSFYHLLKTTSSELNDSKDCLVPFEQTLGTPQELEMINELCVRQHIQPFNSDTKFIELSTFYQYCSANMIFVKELPLSEPKASICKDWASIVQINGGICRLRNIATLHEQTVPFIGNNLLKNFILSSQCLSIASLTKPTPAEMEFLQLILFFSNMSINLRNAQLIDIESVQKEYNVDLILLFNDKFPLNVLNYQQQGNRSNTSQTPIIPANSTAPTNTIAESTPPPSPPSPPTNSPAPTNPPSQMPLTSSTNRYYKPVEFHGHSLTAYICSGLGTNYHRECVSIKSLCNILYPNSPLIDKLEAKMLRLLRSKNINRFRPQNQQSVGFTRLIDIKDAEKHWEYIEQEMRSISNENEEVNIRSSISSTSNENSKASTVERVENDEQSSSKPSVETNKGEKRTLDEIFDDEDIPVLERINKRAKLAEKENNNNEKTQKKRTIKLTSVKNGRKRILPSTRTNKQTQATWVRKYNIEDCCIRLNQYDLEND